MVEPLILDEMNCQLTAPVCDEEIKGPVFQLEAFKSPGLDGFPGFFYQTYCEAVMECMTTVTFSIFANGEKMASVVLTCGLRQGLKIARQCPTLPHLLFADDVLLFLKADVDECRHVLVIVKIYCEASANTPSIVSSSISAAAGLSVSYPNSKYFGLPSFWGRSKAEAYEFIIGRILSKLQGWKQNLLSQVGKEILIMAVVQAIPSYAMACFAFPKKFSAKLNSYIGIFWWRGDPVGKGINWLNWGHMTLLKHRGGMGFRDFNSFNLALLARQEWRLLKYPNSFCARLLKVIYFLNTSFMQAAKGRRGSWAWASIIQGHQLLQEGVR
ncbi:uncharacterized protein LOC114267955 [Camellia sinensis]|uniref:uncharacterized protein LOC114267955 n=1 Tax=Camellia sinensis TaxID=4442 RepID=UPI001036A4FB|nr:uncharacterized protein LOC114267955 [Camellia sinensis]